MILVILVGFFLFFFFCCKDSVTMPVCVRNGEERGDKQTKVIHVFTIAVVNHLRCQSFNPVIQ